MRFLLIYMILINLFTCVLYAGDKLKAIAGKRRIPEKVLIGFAFIGGSLGALIGMQCFRHKTRHLKFQISIPVFLFIHVVVLMFVYS